jgi:hypothetical protein
MRTTFDWSFEMNAALNPVHSMFDTIFVRTPRRVPIGGAALENTSRVLYQSARCRDGYRADLPLTFAAAWEEAHGEDYARAEMADGARA